MALSLNGYSNLTGFKNFPFTSRNLLNCRSGENKFRIAGANLCFQIFLPKVVERSVEKEEVVILVKIISFCYFTAFLNMPKLFSVPGYANI